MKNLYFLLPLLCLILASCSKDEDGYLFDGLAYEADITIPPGNYSPDPDNPVGYITTHYIEYNGKKIIRAYESGEYNISIDLTPHEGYSIRDFTCSLYLGTGTQKNMAYITIHTNIPPQSPERVEFKGNVKIYITPK